MKIATGIVALANAYQEDLDRDRREVNKSIVYYIARDNWCSPCYYFDHLLSQPNTCLSTS
jgi:hypothetical protein